MFVTIGRGIAFALQSFWRNIWLSLATIFIISLTLISVNFLVALNAVSGAAVEAVKEKIDVSVYFKQSVREDKIEEIKSHLATLPQIKKIDYFSAADNLAEFRKRHETDTVITEALNELEGNPLGATIVIKAKNLTDYPEILEAIDNPAYADLIEEKNYDDHQIVISRINSLANNIRKGGLAVSAIFVIIAILIVFNTVRIAIFTHQSEIEIMKLVGASNGFVRAPFILENIYSGIIATAVSAVVVYAILSVVQPYLNSFFGGINFSLINYFNANFLLIFGLQLAGIIILNIISSCLALVRYLKV